MFNLGGGEILVILLLALIVLGPQRLPDAARKLGSAIGEVRRMATGFQTEIKAAFDEADLTPGSTRQTSATTTSATASSRERPASALKPPAGADDDSAPAAGADDVSAPAGPAGADSAPAAGPDSVPAAGAETPPAPDQEPPGRDDAVA
jgi:sec-independent protein translocase protein TatB